MRRKNFKTNCKAKNQNHDTTKKGILFSSKNSLLYFCLYVFNESKALLFSLLIILKGLFHLLFFIAFKL